MGVKINIDRFFLGDSNTDNVTEVSGATIGECLHRLIRQFPSVRKELLFDKRGKLLDYVCIFINGGDAFPEPMARPVKDGDKINIIPVIGGG